MEAFGPYRSFGMLHCPECFQRTEFVSFDPECKDVNDAECCVCGYTFGRVRDDRRPEAALRGVISPAVAAEAMGEHMKFTRHVLRSTDIDPDLAEAYELAARTQQLREGPRRA